MKRIKYVSRFAEPMVGKEIAALASRAEKKNEKLGVTGILMTSGGMFFQVIEGPAEHIDDLYRSILSDPRHVDVLLLGVEDNITERLFPDWGMKKIDLDEKSEIRLEPLKAILRSIIAQEKVLQDLANTLERAIWHETVDAG
ncbi:MAG TPA: BLUF domain-containing protein [bacterium]|nr:BLUF domain-containing protein [bacterium]